MAVSNFSGSTFKIIFAILVNIVLAIIVFPHLCLETGLGLHGYAAYSSWNRIYAASYACSL